MLSTAQQPCVVTRITKIPFGEDRRAFVYRVHLASGASMDLNAAEILDYRKLQRTLLTFKGVYLHLPECESRKTGRAAWAAIVARLLAEGAA